MTEIRTNWTLEELEKIYHTPLLSLLSQATALHTKYHDRDEVQLCTLISIKTGGCPEDCKYCAQSARYKTDVKATPMLSYEEVMGAAHQAIDSGSSRICLGAAWREVRKNRPFAEVLEMIRGITALGVEVCCCLGMLTEESATALKEAGLYAYNHNLDTSESYYPKIITTRTYQDRLNTLDIVENAGITVCCGGILGLGESVTDRLSMILTLATRSRHPESVPFNQLSAIAGTPLENASPVSNWELIRTIATARIALPKTVLRLSAGRLEMSHEEQTLCFMAGANSIFSGEKLLTVGNPSIDRDEKLFRLLGVKKRPAFKEAIS
jgi:biotin synthase